MKRFYYPVFIGIALFISCSAHPPGMATQLGKQTPDTGETLKQAAGFPIGVAIGYGPMNDNSVYANIVKTQFSNVTFEYEMKNGAIMQNDGSLNFSRADELLALCEKDGLNVYGHTLCWYQNDNTNYLTSLKGPDGKIDSSMVENAMKTFITSMIDHYKDKVHAWDVINEPVDDNGLIRTGLSGNSFFYWGQYLGPGYIARAFQYAHAADSSAKLFLNDYNQETNPRKLDSLIAIVNRLKAANIPIDGLGMQMHISINTPDSGIDNAFKMVAATGLLIRISEMDVKVNPSNVPGFIINPSLLEQQAEKVKYAIESFRRNVPAAQQFGVTFWNVGTLDSWIDKMGNNDSPTLFDSAYNKKPDFFAALAAFSEK
ncbi:MAG TPA: endo-1,4-beta-xylanase [Chitinophagaceae bacterium]|nr:endo-1,4-beta-xylanase [Chitinophagaceae bacterium]